MTKPYAYTEALRFNNQPIERLASPQMFSIGATANSLAVPLLVVGTSTTGRKPYFLLFTPEVNCRLQFNQAADANASGHMCAGETYRFFLHSDVTYINAIQTSHQGVAHVTWEY